MKNIKTFEGFFDIKKFENWSDSDGLDISNLKMEVYREAGKYGDSHPEGTMVIYRLTKDQAKYFEREFEMKPFNAPGGYDVEKIDSLEGIIHGTREDGQDMSVGIDPDYDENEGSANFIYLMRDFYNNPSGHWNLFIGPNFVEKVQSMISNFKRKPMLKDDDINKLLKTTLPSQWSCVRKGMELARDYYEKLISDGKLKIN